MRAAADGVDTKRQRDFRDPNVDWSEGCRVSHGESTWYHSTMGRAEKQSRLFEVDERRRTVITWKALDAAPGAWLSSKMHG